MKRKAKVPSDKSIYTDNFIGEIPQKRVNSTQKWVKPFTPKMEECRAQTEGWIAWSSTIKIRSKPTLDRFINARA